jgi:RNA polymerase sigma-70 factor (ECF subfamily)
MEGKNMFLSFATEDERSVFDYLYEKYKRLLYAKAYDILKDSGLAEDAVSEAYIRVYRNMHRIEGPDSGQTAAFLVTIVKNVAITMYHKRNKVVPADFSEYEEASEYNLEQSVETKAEAEQAVELLEKLGEELKAVFLLKYAHGLPHKEIGQVLGITENNVTVKQKKKKKKLNALLGKERHV